MERAQLREADEECHLADGEVAAGQVLRRELVPKLIEDLSKRCVLCGQLAIQRPDPHLQLLCGVLRRRLAAAKLIFEQLPDPATEARRWRHFVHLIGGVPIEHRHERRVGPNTGEIQNRRVQFEDILARPKKDGRAEKAGVFACVGRSGVSEPNEGRYPVDAVTTRPARTQLATMNSEDWRGAAAPFGRRWRRSARSCPEKPSKLGTMCDGEGPRLRFHALHLGS